ncbi:MAG TPA: hypothetical protein VKS19_01495, partial [Verrucomicrobiae bacterium]|nr:hypothetical protein [Verrucomicrobiae bacterium]
PFLTLAQDGTNLIVSWPNPSTGFVLQESPGLSPAHWTNHPAVPQIVAGRKQISTAAADGGWIFRLIRP